MINVFDELDASYSPSNYKFHIVDAQYVVYYEMCFENFPKVEMP